MQQKWNKIKIDPKFRLYAVNIPFRQDTARQAKAVFALLHYDMPLLKLLPGEKTDIYGFNTVPTVLVLYNNRIYYRGDIEGIDQVLNRLKNNGLK